MRRYCKKFFYILWAASVALSACSRFIPGGTPSPTPTLAPPAPISVEPTFTPPLAELEIKGTITIWHSWDETHLPALVDTVDQFQDLYPDVQFDVLYIPPENMLLRYQQAAGEGGGPDLLLGPASWGPVLFDAGLIADLQDIMKEELTKTLNPPALQAMRFGDALIGVPYAIKGVVLYRNTEIIAEAPKSFEEMVSLAQTATQGDVLGAYFERSFYYSGAHLIGIGGQWMNERGDPLFNDSQGAAWIDLLQEFEFAGPVEFQTDHDVELFKAGKVGFIIDGTWNMTTMTETLSADLVAIDPWPVYQTGRLSGFVQGDEIFLNAQRTGTNRPAVIKFMEYLLAPENQLRLANVGFIPSVMGVKVNNNLMAQAMVALAGGSAYPSISQVDVYATPLDAALRSIFKDKVASAEALSKAQQQVKDALAAMQPETPAPVLDATPVQ